MVKHKTFDETKAKIEEAREKIIGLLPDAFKQFPEEVRKHVHQFLEHVFSEFDLLTYEEFSAQKKVLERTRKKLEALEQRVATLEQASHHIKKK